MVKNLKRIQSNQWASRRLESTVPPLCLRIGLLFLCPVALASPSAKITSIATLCLFYMLLSSRLKFQWLHWRYSMKRHTLPVLFVGLLLSGCATKGYVKQQLNPVSCRVDVIESKQTTLEQKAASLESRLNQLEPRVTALEGQVNALPKTMELTPADRALLSDAERRATESAQRAETAARTAESSATAADASAKKAAKSFELGQKK
jgi:outer membrane murein-binding lipoprotein Lpp